MPDVIEALVNFAHTPVPDDVEATQALEMMRLSLLDWASVAIAGAGEPVAKITRELGMADGGTPSSTVIGTAMRLPIPSAALINGATSHALDYDDTHFAHIGHPSVAVIPAALAAAEGCGCTGNEMLEAALIGVEASIRVGVWLGRAHYQTGFHQTATAGAFGATIAAARLMGLTAAQTANALGLCSTRATGLKSQFGTMGKPYHAGMAAQTGVEVARAAQAGFISSPQGLDGPQGFGATHAGEGNCHAFDELGTSWEIQTISHKFHACCHGTHAMIEALSPLMLNPEKLLQLQLETHPRWLSVCNKNAPQTGLEVKFSYAHVAAMVVAGKDTAALDSFTDEIANAPALITLAQKVEVVGDDALSETEVRLVIDTTEGRKQAQFDLAAPMEIDTRRRKLRAKSRALLGAQADRLWAAIEGRGDGVELSSLTRLLRLA